MPILPAEPDIYPEDLFDVARRCLEAASADDPEDDAPPAWWCLHAKPRQEKAAVRFLRERRMPHYLPLVRKESRTPGGRAVRSVVPLFPGYLFLFGDRHQRLEAFRGGQLVDILDVVDQAQLQGDLVQIQRMLGSGLPVAPEPEFPVGSRVRITSGPLQGLVGTVVQRGNRDHFVAIVQFLGRGATVELQGWQVEAVAG
jgi:transcriptional antiterminator RfaH